jgi:SAM-dependent methyltransferase
MPSLYEALADWWPLMSAPTEYAEEAEKYAALLLDACDTAPRSLLELGSGGGNNALHMKKHFAEVVLVDPAPGMLAVSRQLNPDCTHIEGDMRSVRLHREFDCVFVHDAICYMTRADDLARAIETAYVHCRPGGAALFCPDYVTETFRSGTDHGGHDGDSRSLRYLEWVFDPDTNDSWYIADYAFLLRDADGTARVVHDRHVEGLFPRNEWLRLLNDAGFDARAVPFEHSEVEVGTTELFVARRR